MPITKQQYLAAKLLFDGVSTDEVASRLDLPPLTVTDWLDDDEFFFHMQQLSMAYMNKLIDEAEESHVKNLALIKKIEKMALINANSVRSRIKKVTY